MSDFVKLSLDGGVDSAGAGFDDTASRIYAPIFDNFDMSAAIHQAQQFFTPFAQGWQIVGMHANT